MTDDVSHWGVRWDTGNPEKGFQPGCWTGDIISSEEGGADEAKVMDLPPVLSGSKLGSCFRCVRLRVDAVVGWPDGGKLDRRIRMGVRGVEIHASCALHRVS